MLDHDVDAYFDMFESQFEKYIMRYKSGPQKKSWMKLFLEIQKDLVILRNKVKSLDDTFIKEAETREFSRQYDPDAM